MWRNLRAWILRTVLVCALGSELVAPGCRASRREAWELVPLKSDIEHVKLPSPPGLIIERVRFFSATLNEARFFLSIRQNLPRLQQRS